MNKLTQTAGFLLVLLVSVVSLSGCKDDDDDVTPPPGSGNTINDLIVKDSSLTLLESAIIRAGWEDTLRNGNFTLFAPTDSAFRRANISDFNGFSPDSLRRILRNHIVTTRYPAADIPTANNTELTTLGNGRVYATKTAAGAVFVNGIPVTGTEVSADNGIIHRINGILLPALGNLSQLAARDSSYSLLAAAVARASTSNAALGTALTGTTPYTVFAPTNAAFRAAGFGSTSAIAGADSSTLASILGNHVLTGRVFASDLRTGAVPTVGGSSVTFAQSGTGYTIAGSGNGSQAAAIAPTNSVATNGVFYSIDRVLLSAP